MLLRQACSSSAFLIFNRYLSTASSLCAGHSHWQNVRHIKAARDKIKSSKSVHFTNLIRKAVREKQPSERIKEIMLSARAAQIPQSTLERALSDSEMVDPYIIAGRATGGIIVLAESTCSKVVRERQLMASICKKYGFKVTEKEASIARDLFDHTGFIICEPNEKMTNLDEAMEVGLEVGAEEVESVQISDSETLFQFQCPPRELPQISKSLEDLGIVVVESEDRYSPKELVQITSESYQHMEEMYGKLRDSCDGIDRIFDNVEIS